MNRQRLTPTHPWLAAVALIVCLLAGLEMAPALAQTPQGNQGLKGGWAIEDQANGVFAHTPPGSLGQQPPRETTPTAEPLSPPVTGPISSAGDPSDPVPFRWTIVRGGAGEGGRLLLQGGTIHAIADLARLLDAAGEALATAPATPVTPGADPCFGRVGIVRVELRVPEETLALLVGEWPTEYRAEVRVGGIWRPTTLTYTECPREE